MKIPLLVAFTFFTVLIILFLWASYPWKLTSYDFQDEIKNTGALSDIKGSTLNVMTWNISYAYGLGSEGTAGYSPQSSSHHEKNLLGIAETIKRKQSDIVFLQEVDFYSARSHYQDQISFLCANTQLKNSARALSWQANYVPHPLEDFSSHFGKVYSGGAVISRWPIVENRVYLLEKPKSKAWWYNLFYLYRYVQVVTIDVLGKKIKVANLHLEAFDSQNKNEQALFLLQLMKSEKVDILAGDFNTLPLGALKRSGFSNPLDDYDYDKTPEILKALPLKEIVDPTTYQMDENIWFTFPSDKPDRRLDYIYYAESWNLLNKEVTYPSRSEISDHLPVSASFKLFDPQFIQD